MSNFQDDWGIEAKGPKDVASMMEKRHRLVLSPTGQLWVHDEILLASGEWHKVQMREATEKEIGIFKELQMKKAKTTAPAAAPEPVKSGSHNDHARLAPSASKQWTQCTASIAYAAANKHRVPEDRGSKWSEEGTEAHDWAAKLLAGACALGDLPDSFAEPVGAYVAHCMSLVPDGVAPLVEIEVPLFYQPSSTGTCDFAVVTDDRVVVRDYKHGEGVLVHSFENPQLAIYALSLIRSREILHNFSPATECDIAVFQPRHREGHDQKPWVIALADLEAFCREIESSATKAHVAFEQCAEAVPGFGTRDVTAREILEAAPGVVFSPSEGDDGACRWCPAKGFCETRFAACTEPVSGHVVDPAGMINLLGDLPEEETNVSDPVERIAANLRGVGVDEPLTDEFLVSLYRSWKRLSAFYADVADYLRQRAEAGTPVAGTKLVLGRAGDRAWVDEAAADTFLTGQKLKKDERYKMVLKSPAQIEKLLKLKFKASARSKSRFEELVTRGDAKPVLALEDDKREAVSAGVDLLGDLPEEEPAFDLS
ncbi:MAG: DUF2800 domain-containing protein [Phycisphaerales bacterium]|jgi:hypothetical protein